MELEKGRGKNIAERSTLFKENSIQIGLKQLRRLTFAKQPISITLVQSRW